MSPPPRALVAGPDGKLRCAWGASAPDYLPYHDGEWGLPTGDDVRLFEKVCLEGFQSGLSWLTILRKREAFRRAFAGFDLEQVARFGARDVARLLADPGIVRHRGKIESTINNARRALRAAGRARLARRVLLALRARSRLAPPAAHLGGAAGDEHDARVGGPLEGPPPARLDVRRTDHRLRLHAGGRHRRRPPRRLRLPRARRARPARVRAARRARRRRGDGRRRHALHSANALAASCTDGGCFGAHPTSTPRALTTAGSIAGASALAPIVLEGPFRRRRRPASRRRPRTPRPQRDGPPALAARHLHRDLRVRREHEHPLQVVERLHGPPARGEEEVALGEPRRPGGRALHDVEHPHAAAVARLARDGRVEVLGARPDARRTAGAPRPRG